MCCSRVCKARRKATRPPAVLGHADQAARQCPHQRLPRCDESGMGASEGHRNSEALRRTDGDVGPVRTGRGKQSEGEQISDDGNQGPGLVSRCDRRPMVDDRSARARIRQERSERLGEVEVGRSWRPSPRCRAARRASGPPRSFADGSPRRPRRPSGRHGPRRRHIVIASAAAVPSSSSEALAISRPVRSDTMVWKVRSISRRPWEISA